MQQKPHKPRMDASTHTSMHQTAATSDHYAFAAYANQATHNLHLLFADVALHIGVAAGSNESDLKSHALFGVLGNPKKVRQEQKAMELLQRGFSFMLPLQARVISCASRERYAAENNTKKTTKTHNGKKGKHHTPSSDDRTLMPDDYARVLKLLIETLHEQRNRYSHYTDTPSRTLVNSNLIGLLDDIFDAAVRTVKNRFSLEEKEVAHLRRFVSKGRNRIDNPAFKYHFVKPQNVKNEGVLTDKGLAFLICLLLGKQDAYQFLKQLKGFKRGESAAEKATLEVFTCFSLRMPMQRIATFATGETLALDMLNELTRCPRVLYKRLHEDEQAKYKMADDAQEDADESDPHANTPLHIRSSERFVPLLMRYFDQTQAFESIRFAVDVGNVCFKAYPKKLATGAEHVRRLVRKGIVYARITDAEQAYTTNQQDTDNPSCWQQHEKDPAEIAEDYPHPYITRTLPHYHMAEPSNVAIRLLDSKTDVSAPAQVYPAIQRVDTQGENDTAGFELHMPANPQPDCIVSQHDLLHWAFYDHLHRASSGNTSTTRTAGRHPLETIVSSYRATIRKLYKDIAEETLHPISNTGSNKDAFEQALQEYTYTDGVSGVKTHLRLKDIPKPLVQWALRKKANVHGAQHSAQRTLKALLEDTEKRLHGLKRATTKASQDKRNRAGSGKQKLVKAGEVADFVARDCMRLMPAQDGSKDNQGKPTSLVFSELQAHLAFYGRDREQLKQLAQDTGLTTGAHAHPFLARVINGNHMGIVSLYRDYLTKRQEYLERIDKEIKTRHLKPDAVQKILAKYPWLQRTPPYFDKNKAKRLLENNATINLPRNLLHPFILHALGKIDCPPLQSAIQQATADNHGTPPNVSYLMQLYYQHYRNDGYPAVYDAKRNYTLIDKALDTRKANDRKSMLLPLRKHYIDNSELRDKNAALHNKIATWIEQEPAKKSSLSHEQSIAQRKKMWRTLQQTEKRIRQIRVQDQALFLTVGWLMPSLLRADGAQAKLQTIDSQILNQHSPIQLHIHGKTVRQQSLRIRKFGEFRRFLKDRRLPTLFTYYRDPALERETIQTELESYQRARLQAFKRILEFEKMVASNCPPLAQSDATANDKKPSRHEEVLRRWFTHKQKDIEPSEIEAKMHQMLVLRNAFFHNQYPARSNAYSIKYKGSLLMLKEAEDKLMQHSQPEVAHYFLQKVHELYAWQTEGTVQT